MTNSRRLRRSDICPGIADHDRVVERSPGLGDRHGQDSRIRLCDRKRVLPADRAKAGGDSQCREKLSRRLLDLVGADRERESPRFQPVERGDDAFRALANDGIKTIRKKNGVMIFGTQSPRDALASPIAHTIVEQCPTQIFFPNARGQASDYVDGFHLTKTEFRLLREDLSTESRRFLIKQGHDAVIAESILNRIVAGAEILPLDGPNMRRHLADAQ